MHPLLAAKQNFTTKMLLKAILIGKDAPESDSIGKDPSAIAAEEYPLLKALGESYWSARRTSTF